MSRVDWCKDLPLSVPFQSMNEWMISRGFDSSRPQVDNPDREVYHVRAADIYQKPKAFQTLYQKTKGFPDFVPQRLTYSCHAGSRKGRNPRKLRVSTCSRTAEDNVCYGHFNSVTFERYGWTFQTCVVHIRETDGRLSSIFRSGATRLDCSEFKFKFDADTSDPDVWCRTDFGDTVANVWRDYIYDHYCRFLVFCEMVSPLLKAHAGFASSNQLAGRAVTVSQLYGSLFKHDRLSGGISMVHIKRQARTPHSM
jgi:hypothetical protein